MHEPQPITRKPSPYRIVRSFVTAGAVITIVLLYMATSVSKRSTLDKYQHGIDSTTALLDKIARIQMNNQIKLLQLRDKLPDTSIALVRPPVRPASTAARPPIDPVIIKTSYTGIANADSVVFGIDACTYSITMKDIKLNVQLNKTKDSILAASLQSYAEEKKVDCRITAPLTPPHQQLYLLQSYTIKDSLLNILFSPADGNQPKCNVSFTAVIHTNTISGTLIWKRYDMNAVPTYNYEIKVPINLQLE